MIINLGALDYSMNSPCLCTYSGPKEKITFDKCEFFVYSNTKKVPGNKNIKVTPQKAYGDNTDRFDNLSAWVLDILTKKNIDSICIEGYSYGSKSSRLFDIGENTGVLKSNLRKNNISFLVVAPTDIKKFYTGKGNANKDKMYETLKETENVFIGEKTDSPVSDIVDAYAIMLRMISTLED